MIVHSSESTEEYQGEPTAKQRKKIFMDTTGSREHASGIYPHAIWEIVMMARRNMIIGETNKRDDEFRQAAVRLVGTASFRSKSRMTSG